MREDGSVKDKRKRRLRLALMGEGGVRGDGPLVSYGLLPEGEASSPLNAWVLPRGKHGVDSAKIASLQRARLLLGVVRAVARKGYADTRVADVIDEAGLSRKTFYREFKDKEACYLAAYEAGSRAHIDAIVRSQRPDSPWEQRLSDAVEAYLRFFMARPEGTFALMVEVHAAGERAWALRDAVFARFARLHAQLYRWRREAAPELPELPEAVFAGLVAASDDMICRAVRQGRASNLLELKPPLLFLMHAVYSPAADTLAVLEPHEPSRRKSRNRSA
jgi:AcrR family transcriptional regulator